MSVDRRHEEETEAERERIARMPPRLRLLAVLLASAGQHRAASADDRCETVRIH